MENTYQDVCNTFHLQSISEHYRQCVCNYVQHETADLSGTFQSPFLNHAPRSYFDLRGANSAQVVLPINIKFIPAARVMILLTKYLS